VNYTHTVSAYIKELFPDEAIAESSPKLAPTPFTYILLPKRAIAFHIIPLNTAILSSLENDFFFLWASHAEKNKIQAIHIWEDRWLGQETIVKSQLNSLAKKTATVFARNTVVERITQPQANAFLQEHHLGGSPIARFKYGIFHKKTKELLGAATFSPPRKFYREEKEYRSYELIRYASKLNTTITGGLSKVLKAFIKDVDPDDIMTYADRDWWTGRSYYPLGFKQTELMPTLGFWLKLPNYTRFTKQQLLALHKNELNRQKNVELTRWLEEKGYIRLYNSGTKKFLLRLK
jgi:hypothetical protein